MFATQSLTFSPAARGDHLRKLLHQAAGISLDTDHEGEWETAGGTAAVRLEPCDRIGVWLPMAGRPRFEDVLEITHSLPGNLRYAVVAGQLGLLADTRLDGEAHLGATLKWIDAGLGRASGKTAAEGRATEPLDRDRAKRSLADAAGAEEELIDYRGGWEFGRRVCGEPVTLRAAVEDAELRVFREILPAIPAATAGPVHWQTLHYNGRLRHARLALDGPALVAETRLHAGLLRAEWVAMALDAVAVAVRHVLLPLRILSEQEEVAQCLRQAIPVRPR
ncbi:MAG: hypothetical protein HUU20_14795 [Pirellulales bacterium]|nr:hypothetical protein [Pirellulales bacterium]